MNAAARKTKSVAIYLRVSTTGQTVDNQKRELEQAAKRHGWHVVKVFKDAGISGAKGRDKRPGLNTMLQGVARREFDLIAAWSVDRLGRSLQDLIGTLGELHAKDVGLYLHQQGLDTSTPSGKAMFQMLGVFAEFERSMIRERVAAGLKRAKAEGKTLGRPRVDAAVEAAARKALRSGKGIRKVARELGIGTSTVQRVAAELKAVA
jgi:DNA invertase Pin-like site-specific DNA recombinase